MPDVHFAPACVLSEEGQCIYKSLYVYIEDNLIHASISVREYRIVYYIYS